MIKLSNFEKISEDKKCATLRHKDGHEMKILVRALSPIQREQLKRLKMANGGQVKMYDEGSQDSPVSNDDSAPSSSISDAPAPAVPATTININATPPAAPAPVSLPPQNTPPPVVNAPTIEPDNSKIQTNSLGPNPLPAVEAQQQAAQDQAKIDATKSQANQQVTTDQIKALQDNAQFDKSNFDELHQHANDYAAHIQAIDPDRVFKQMGTGEKIANSIGLLIGGFGSAKMFGGTNYAYENLQKSIDRDIDAQKTNNTNQQNIYKAYESLYGNGVLASKMAKVSMNDLAARKADLISHQVGSAQGQINANNLKAKLMLDNQKTLQDATYILGNLRRGGGDNGLNATGNQTAKNVAPTGANESVAIAPKNEEPKAAGYVINSGTKSGMSNAPEQEQQFTATPPSPILRQDADDLMNRLNRSGDPAIQKDLPKIQEQFTQARQLDEAMPQIAAAYNRMVKERNGLSGRIHRGINPNAIAGVGAGIGATAGGLGFGVPTAGAGAIPGIAMGATEGGAAGKAIGETVKAMTNTAENRNYDKDKAAMLTYLSGALKNVGVGQLQEILESNLPETGDEPKDIEHGWNNLKEKLQQLVQKDTLERHNIRNKQK